VVSFWNNFKYSIITTIVILGCVIYYYIDPSQYQFMPKCPVKLLTTFACPGCGFQRALHAVLHGNINEAVHYNLFLLIAIPLTCIWIFNSFIIEHTSRDSFKLKMVNLNKILIYFYLISYFIWFILRNIYKI